MCAHATDLIAKQVNQFVKCAAASTTATHSIQKPKLMLAIFVSRFASIPSVLDCWRHQRERSIMDVRRGIGVMLFGFDLEEVSQWDAANSLYFGLIIVQTATIALDLLDTLRMCYKYRAAFRSIVQLQILDLPTSHTDANRTNTHNAVIPEHRRSPCGECVLFVVLHLWRPDIRVCFRFECVASLRALIVSCSERIGPLHNRTHEFEAVMYVLIVLCNVERWLWVT